MASHTTMSPIYDTLDHDTQPQQPHQMGYAPMYGTFQMPLPVVGHPYVMPHPMPRPSQHQQQAVVYTNDYSRTPKIIARETPLQLPDGETVVEYKTGNYARMVMLLIFFALLPLGLCYLAFLPLCFKCKWTKDFDHIDPVTGHSVATFQRGSRDAPPTIRCARLAEQRQQETYNVASRGRTRSQSARSAETNFQNEGRRVRISQSDKYVRRHNNRSSGSDNDKETTPLTSQPVTVQQEIKFTDRPAALPDGQMTEVRTRIGSCSLLCAFITLLIGYMGVLPLAPLSLLCFVMPCFKNVEHIHPQTREIVGTYYRGR